MSQTTLPRIADTIPSRMPEHGDAAGTLSVGELPLPPAGASAADPVVVAGGVGEARGLSGAGEGLKSAFFVAATMNWMLNRLWTFRGRGSDASLVRQWLSFLGANGLGFVLNRSTFFALSWLLPFCRAHLVTALAAGSLAGMCANFTLSRRLVFR